VLATVDVVEDVLVVVVVGAVVSSSPQADNIATPVPTDKQAKVMSFFILRR